MACAYVCARRAAADRHRRHVDGARQLQLDRAATRRRLPLVARSCVIGQDRCMNDGTREPTHD
eukprot:5955232-Pleurochrysis_carterae.AAC.2